MERVQEADAGGHLRRVAPEAQLHVANGDRDSVAVGHHEAQARAVVHNHAVACSTKGERRA